VVEGKEHPRNLEMCKYYTTYSTHSETEIRAESGDWRKEIMSYKNFCFTKRLVIIKGCLLASQFYGRVESKSDTQKAF